MSGNNVDLHVLRSARLPAVRLLPLQRRGRAAAHLQGVQAAATSRPATSATRRSSSAPGRTRTSRASAPRPSRSCGRSASDWWATKALGLKVGADLRRRHQERDERGGARRTCSPATSTCSTTSPRRAAIKGNVQDVLQRRAVPPRREHDVAVPEHDEEAARRPAVPSRAGRLDRPAADPRQGLPGPRRTRRARRACCRSGTSGSTRSVVKQYGFSYNAGEGEAILADAGYKDTNGDGYVENKDGSPINLKIVVPNGWSDWMTAIQVISASAKAAGIKITPAYPEYGTLVDDRGHAQLRPRARQRPAVLEHAVDVLPVHLPAAHPGQPDDGQLRALHEPERLEPDQAARQDAVDERRVYQGDDVEAPDDCSCRICPAIPLWYNGMWAMVNTQYWTNWPSATGAQYTPTLLAELLPDDEHRHAHAHLRPAGT